MGVVFFIVLGLLGYRAAKDHDGKGVLSYYDLHEFHFVKGVFAGLIAYLSNIFVGFVFSQFFQDGVRQQYYKDSSIEFYISGIIVLVILAPFVEEIIFRGRMFRQYRKDETSNFSYIVLSSGFWAICHVGQGWHIPFVLFLPGIIFCVTRIKLRSVWPAFFAHATMNLLIFGGWIYI